MVCDLADLQSVRAFASALSEKAATLDCLCLNSGVSPSRKVVEHDPRPQPSPLPEA